MPFAAFVLVAALDGEAVEDALFVFIAPDGGGNGVEPDLRCGFICVGHVISFRVWAA